MAEHLAIQRPLLHFLHVLEVSRLNNAYYIIWYHRIISALLHATARRSKQCDALNDQLAEQRHQAQHLGIDVLTARCLAWLGFEDFEAWYRMVWVESKRRSRIRSLQIWCLAAFSLAKEESDGPTYWAIAYILNAGTYFMTLDSRPLSKSSSSP